jgi:hypothetical protein
MNQIADDFTDSLDDLFNIGGAPAQRAGGLRQPLTAVRFSQSGAGVVAGRPQNAPAAF